MYHLLNCRSTLRWPLEWTVLYQYRWDYYYHHRCTFNASKEMPKKKHSHIVMWRPCILVTDVGPQWVFSIMCWMDSLHYVTCSYGTAVAFLHLLPPLHSHCQTVFHGTRHRMRNATSLHAPIHSTSTVNMTKMCSCIFVNCFTVQSVSAFRRVDSKRNIQYIP